VITCSTDASFAVVLSTPPPWHIDAVGWRHPIEHWSDAPGDERP
jgi:hypothetical protein